MRMNRRAFSFTPTVAAPPVVGEEYLVKIWSITGDRDWDSELSPGGVYGSFAEGTTVEVDLSPDYDVFYVTDVTSYEDASTKVSYRQLDDLRVSFVMPAFDVAVEVETSY